MAKIHDELRSYYERVAFVLQGGGALGAYQVGAYEVLYDYHYEPNWVVGTSIGAINAALIVGNPPEKRVEKLRQFWKEISTPDLFGFGKMDEDNIWSRLGYLWGAQMALCFGQPNFFVPKMVNPWCIPLGKPTDISFYDCAPLKATLERLVDFDRINAREIVLKVGAVAVKSGKIKYFSNLNTRISAEHIMASCALPPGFPAVQVGKEYYWDGGVHSNTPLNMVLDAYPPKNTLCFMVDLFSAIGSNPVSLDEIFERKKEINFASHSKRPTKLYSTRQNLRHAIARLGEMIPKELKESAEVQEILRLGAPNQIDIMHLIYNSEEHFSCKDFDFSEAAIAKHIRAGRKDTEDSFASSNWQEWVNEKDKIGVTVYKAPNNPNLEEDIY